MTLDDAKKYYQMDLLYGWEIEIYSFQNETDSESYKLILVTGNGMRHPVTHSKTMKPRKFKSYDGVFSVISQIGFSLDLVTSAYLGDNNYVR